MDAVTENPAVGATRMWELYNTTADAHPMHIHEITFEVVNREVARSTKARWSADQLDGNVTRQRAGNPASRTP